MYINATCRADLSKLRNVVDNVKKTHKLVIKVSEYLVD